MKAQSLALAAGGLLLMLTWLGPLPARAQDSFLSHMAMHVSVTAIAAPLLAAGLSCARPPGGAWAWSTALGASMLDFLVIWGWHTPTLHQAARTGSVALALEQASFLVVSVLVWRTALSARERAQAFAGIGALLFTSMHMTLLGTLLTLSPRPLYGDHDPATQAAWIAALDDQRRGGLLMLLGAGSAYALGALGVLMRALRWRGSAMIG